VYYKFLSATPIVMVVVPKQVVVAVVMDGHLALANGTSFKKFNQKNTCFYRRYFLFLFKSIN